MSTEYAGPTARSPRGTICNAAVRGRGFLGPLRREKMRLIGMGPVFALELGDQISDQECAKCGNVFWSLRGFVYRDGDAWIAYHAQLHERHPDRRVLLLVTEDSGGGEPEWSAGASTFIESWIDGEEVRSGVGEPAAAPWKLDDQQLVGRALTRDEALARVDANNLWVAVDFIERSDPALREFLGLQEVPPETRRA